MKTRTLATLMVMLSLAAAALLVAAADVIRLPSDGGEGLVAGQAGLAAAAGAEATEKKEGGDEDDEAAREKGGADEDEETRPWACCNNTVCTESYSFSPTCRCLDMVDRCAGACQRCEPSASNPFRHICKDEYHGDPGPTCPKDDDDVPSPSPSGADEETRPWACCNNTVCTESYSFSTTCRCLDVVDRCAGACQQCEPSASNPFRHVCKDEYQGDPGPTCPKDDDDDVPSPSPSGASRSVGAAARLLFAFIAALLFIQSR